MDKITPKVYDLGYPSPIPLRELSAIAVAIELWHLNLEHYFSNGDLTQDFWKKIDAVPMITLRNMIPYVPLVIDQMTKVYLRSLMRSMDSWLFYNFDKVFSFYRNNCYAILNDFDDIVCDYDGTIDYTRTAKRMMLCNQISQLEKFTIACEYSFEDDIRRIGPSVLSKVAFNEIDYNKHPNLYYWVCCLGNELDKIPNEGNVPIGELMLEKTSAYINNRSSFEYFWNLAGLESRYQIAKTLCRYDAKDLSFCGRFILPMLNEAQLTKLVAEKGAVTVVYIMDNLKWRSVTKDVVLGVWMYIKDKINETDFVEMIEHILLQDLQETRCTGGLSCCSVGKFPCPNTNEIALSCCEIWASAADNFKQSAIKNVLLKKWKLLRPFSNQSRQFLLTVLLDATSKDRSVFWNYNWLLLRDTTCCSHFDRIMKLCLANEDEISQFFRKL